MYFHKNPDINKRQPHSELDIYSTLNKDIYSIFSSVSGDNTTAFIKIMVNPLVKWVWIGGYILAFGTVIALGLEKNSDESYCRIFFTFIIFILPIIYVVQPFFMQGFGEIISSESLEILKRKKNYSLSSN